MQISLRTIAYAAATLLLITSGCVFSEQGESPDDQRDSGVPEVDAAPPIQDASVDEVGPMACVPSEPGVVCALVGTTCGTYRAPNDGCVQGAVEYECGMCPIGFGCKQGSCECVPPDDDEMCAQMGAGVCGDVFTFDPCTREPRTLACGDCAKGSECTNNQCACIAESDEAFCDRLDAQGPGEACGAVEAQDNCGQTRVGVDCGGCGPGAACAQPEPGGAEAIGRCECIDTAQAVCVRAGRRCGTLEDAVNECGDELGAIECGTCPNGETCSGAGQCTGGCVPLSQSEFCAAQSADACGTISGSDGCGGMMSADCGTCERDEVCNENNRCECEELFCGTAECGMVSNACSSRSCGECGRGENCVSNQCVCPPPVCIKGQCGTIRNQCGARTNCGNCPGANEQCQTNNQCLCVPYDTQTACSEASKQCGDHTLDNGCGASAPYSCGAASSVCTRPANSCVDGSCVCLDPNPACSYCTTNCSQQTSKASCEAQTKVEAACGPEFTSCCRWRSDVVIGLGLLDRASFAEEEPEQGSCVARSCVGIPLGLD